MSEGQSLPERWKNYLSEKYGKLERQAAFEYNQHLREHEKSLKKLSKKSIGYLSEKYTELGEYVASKYDQHLSKYEEHFPEQVVENKGWIAIGGAVATGYSIYSYFRGPDASLNNTNRGDEGYTDMGPSSQNQSNLAATPGNNAQPANNLTYKPTTKITITTAIFLPHSDATTPPGIGHEFTPSTETVTKPADPRVGSVKHKVAKEVRFLEAENPDDGGLDHSKSGSGQKIILGKKIGKKCDQEVNKFMKLVRKAYYSSQDKLEQNFAALPNKVSKNVAVFINNLLTSDGTTSKTLKEEFFLTAYHHFYSEDGTLLKSLEAPELLKEGQETGLRHQEQLENRGEKLREDLIEIQRYTDQAIWLLENPDDVMIRQQEFVRFLCNYGATPDSLKVYSNVLRGYIEELMQLGYLHKLDEEMLVFCFAIMDEYIGIIGKLDGENDTPGNEVGGVTVIQEQDSEQGQKGKEKREEREEQSEKNDDDATGGAIREPSDIHVSQEQVPSSGDLTNSSQRSSLLVNIPNIYQNNDLVSPTKQGSQDLSSERFPVPPDTSTPVSNDKSSKLIGTGNFWENFPETIDS